jgi:hypothetical protein
VFSISGQAWRRSAAIYRLGAALEAMRSGPVAISDQSEALGQAVALARDAVMLIADEHAHACRIGGAPDLSPDLAWPRREDRPLAFIAQLDCGALRHAGRPDWLPNAGMLFFFYDLVEQPWGFDPADRGSWAVLHDPNGRAQTIRTWPDGLDDDPDRQLVATSYRAAGLHSMPGMRRICDEDMVTLDDDVEEGSTRFAVRRSKAARSTRSAAIPTPSSKTIWSWNAPWPAMACIAGTRRVIEARRLRRWRQGDTTGDCCCSWIPTKRSA